MNSTTPPTDQRSHMGPAMRPMANSSPTVSATTNPISVALTVITDASASRGSASQA